MCETSGTYAQLSRRCRRGKNFVALLRSASINERISGAFPFWLRLRRIFESSNHTIQIGQLICVFSSTNI